MHGVKKIFPVEYTIHPSEMDAERRKRLDRLEMRRYRLASGLPEIRTKAAKK